MNLTPLLLIIPVAIFLTAWYLFPLRTGRWLISAERFRNGVHSRTIHINKTHWHYLEAGRGVPLLALHGIAADADHWTRLAGLLRKNFRIIAPDLPGFGCSVSPPGDGFTIDDQVGKLHDFVIALGLDTLFLAGNSMGGQVAAAYAVRYPGQIRGLFLLAPSGVMGARFSTLMKAVVRDEQNPFVVRNAHDFDALINACFYHKPWIPGPVRKMLLARAVRLGNKSRTAFDEIRFFSPSLEYIAAEIPVRCLILWGNNDEVLDVSGAPILARIIPGSELVVLDKTGHLPMLEEPAKCAQLMQQFVEGLDAAGNNSPG